MDINVHQRKKRKIIEHNRIITLDISLPGPLSEVPRGQNILAISGNTHECFLCRFQTGIIKSQDLDWPGIQLRNGLPESHECHQGRSRVSSISSLTRSPCDRMLAGSPLGSTFNASNSSGCSAAQSWPCCKC